MALRSAMYCLAVLLLVPLLCSAQFGLEAPEALRRDSEFGDSKVSLQPTISASFDSKNQLFVNWTIKSEITDLKRYLLTYSLNDSNSTTYYIIKSEFEATAANQTILYTTKDADGCHFECYQQIRCLAYSFSLPDKVCRLKLDSITSRAEKCQADRFCANVEEYQNRIEFKNFFFNSIYKFQVAVLVGDALDGYFSDPFPVSTAINFSIMYYGPVIENAKLTFVCNVNPVLFNIASFQWYLDDNPANLTALNATVAGNALNLTLDHKLHDGTYKCEVTLDSQQKLQSSNSFDLAVEHAPQITFTPASPNNVYRYNVTEKIDINCYVDSRPLKFAKWQPRTMVSHPGRRRVVRTVNSSVTVDYISEPSATSQNNGTYTCCAEPTDTCMSIDILIQSRPSTPKIVNATYSFETQMYYIKWELVDQSNLKISSMKISTNNSEVLVLTTNISSLVENHEFKGRLDILDINVMRISFSNDLLGEGDESEPFIVEKIGQPGFKKAELPLGVIISVALVVFFLAVFIVITIRNCEKRYDGELSRRSDDKKEDNDSELEMDRYQETPMSGEMPNQSDDSPNEAGEPHREPEREYEGSPSDEDPSFPQLNTKRRHFDEEKMKTYNEMSDNDQDERPRVTFKRRPSMPHMFFYPSKPASHYLHADAPSTPSNVIPMKHLRPPKHQQSIHQGETIGSAHTLDELYKCWNDGVDDGKLDDILRNELDNMKNADYLKSNDAQQEYNLPKSRYNIYPYDYNRVKLSTLPDVDGSDFINASFIEGPDKSKKFIAAQSPSKTTIEDFLRMLFEKEIHVMIMLCKFRENASSKKLRCYQFWSDTQDVRVGKYLIKSSLVDNKCSYLKRQLNILDTEANLLRELDHYQYTEWADKSVPDEAETVMSIIERVNSENGREKWPFLVFCHSGVGRTGTFICLDILKHQIEEKQPFGVKQLVTNLRIQRSNFVETWEQYKFIYFALLQKYIFGKTTIYKDKLDKQFNKLTSFEGSKKKNVMETEFDKLNFFKDIPKSQDIYVEHTRMFKSKNSSPYDDALIDINHESNDPTEKYLDAVKFEPSQIDIKFILAADPSDSKIDKFMQLIFLRHPAIIVSCSSNFYLPDPDETTTYGTYKISNKGASTSNLISYYNLEFLNTQNDEKLSVCYFDCVKIWQHNNEPSNRSAFIDIINSFLKLAGNKLETINDELSVTVLIQSTDGGDRCAVFAASSVLFNSIMLAKQFDVTKIVRQLRKCRRKLISNMTLYRFLYEICRQHIQSASTFEKSQLNLMDNNE